MNLGPNRQKLETIALTLLRITVGVIMAAHGWLKVTDIPGTITAFTNTGLPFPEISAYLAIAGELGGGLGLIIGLLTPLAAFGVFATMTVAIGKIHWANGLLARDGGFEYPLALLAVALYFIGRGGGCLSLDTLLFKCKKDGASSGTCCG